MKPAFNPARLRLLLRAACYRGKSDTQIPPEVAVKLERCGVDSVRAQLDVSTEGWSGTARNARLDLGHGLTVSRGEAADWLTEKEAVEACWVRVGAVMGILATLLAFLAWAYPFP